MKITIVTVCRNAENCIRETIDSVLNQTFSDFQYLIIDGASTDNTVEIIKSYSEAFDSRNIIFSYISEPDKGIYDAMNKSLKYVNGEWIQFMNAGDSFCDSEVLDMIFRNSYEGCDLVYGDILLKENGMYKKDKAGHIDDQVDHSPICHQAVLVRTASLKKYSFDDRYNLAADYDLFIRMYKDGKVFFYVNKLIAVFELGGASYKRSAAYLKEMYESRSNLGIQSHCPFLIVKMKLSIYLLIRDICRKYLKFLFYSEKRGWYSEINSFK